MSNGDEPETLEIPPEQATLDRIRRLAGDVDVRIHDTGQAGELARRLGAEAFAAGRDIYVQPHLVRPLTPRGVALLAHEMWHVAEQSGKVMPAGMPLLRPARKARSVVRAPSGFGGDRAFGIEGRASTGSPQPPVPVQRERSGVSTSEAAAESVEAAALHEAGKKRRRKRVAVAPDPQEVADRVYRMMARDLLLDRERATHGW